MRAAAWHETRSRLRAYWRSLPPPWRSRATLGALAFAVGALLLLGFQQVVSGAVRAAHERDAAAAAGASGAIHFMRLETAADTLKARS